MSKNKIRFHIVWIPKYRRKIIKSQVEIRLKEILNEKITSLGLQLIALECMPDHIHLFIKANTNTKISFIVKC